MRARKTMIVRRVIGGLLLVAGIVIFARDINGWADTDTFTFVATGELWFALHSGSLNLLQVITQRYVFPQLWDPILVTVLLWPAFLVFGVPGLIVSWLVRPERLRRRRNHG